VYYIHSNEKNKRTSWEETVNGMQVKSKTCCSVALDILWLTKKEFYRCKTESMWLVLPLCKNTFSLFMMHFSGDTQLSYNSGPH